MISKLNVTFSVAPRLNLSFVNFGERVISTNLMRNKNLNVKFDYIVPLENKFYTENVNKLHSLYDLKVEEMDEKFFLHIKEFLPDFYKNHIKKTIDTEYVIVSLANLLGGTGYVKHLLEAGKRVVAGGAAINFVTMNNFRNVLVNDLHVDKELVYKNLIIIQGYADLYFNFYEAIKQWKDIVIPNESVDFKSMYEADFSFLAPFYPKESFILLFLYIGCSWRGCKHCWMSIKNGIYKKNLNICDLISPDVLKNYYELSKRLYPQINQAYIVDNYVSTNTLQFVKDSAVSDLNLLYASTGVKELLNKEYTDLLFSINKNLMLAVGFDYINEFSLNFMNKGYNISDIFKSLSIMEEATKKYDTKLIIKANRITDAPMDFKWREREEDENLEKMDRQFSKYGKYIDCRYSQMIYPESYLDIHPSKYYKKVSSHEEKYTSGAIRGLTYLFKDYNLLGELKYFTKPFVRYDERGNIIKARVDEVDNYNIQFSYASAEKMVHKSKDVAEVKNKIKNVVKKINNEI